VRLAVISDVHGNLPALERVLSHLESQSPDAIVNLGDCVSAPLWPEETFARLRALDIPTVRGNHDRWVAEPPRDGESATVGFSRRALSDDQISFLGGLPASLTISDEILAVHGTPSSDTDYLMEESVDDRLTVATAERISARLGDTTASLILCGHSHQQHAVFAGGNRLVVNPGSVGCPRYADNKLPERNEAGSPHARYAVVTGSHGKWSVEFFILDYDWSRVVSRAMEMGRPDWAAGFLKN
jgi:putative phosphoesterase